MTKTALEIVDEIAVRMELVKACKLAGNVSNFARIHQLDPIYVEAVMRGRSSPRSLLLEILGYSKVTRYVKRARSDAA